jgi:serine/threonine-protein kinase HipA
MMRFAAEVGISVAETGLVRTGDIQGMPERFRTEGNALWVKRFDRTDTGERIHMEDFNQLYNQMPNSKYDHYSYGNMLGDLARISNIEDVREFIRRLIFSAAVGNTDMHLKNWTLVYPDGRHPRLSPAYDFVSVISYINDNRLALSVHKEKAIPKFDDGLLERFARALPIPVAVVMDTAHETARKIVHTWRHLAPELPMASPGKALIEQQFREFPITAQFTRG